MPRTLDTRLRFELRLSKDKDKGSITAIIKKGGVTCDYAIGIGCKKSEWVKEELTPYATGKRIAPERATAMLRAEVKEFNQELSDWADLLLNIHKDATSVKNRNKPLTPQRFRALVDERLGLKTTAEKKTPGFLEFAAEYVNKRLIAEAEAAKARGKQATERKDARGKAATRVPGEKTTAYALKRAYVILSAYCSKNGKMGYTDFSHQWVERFHKFLFTPCEFRFKLKFAGEVTEYQFKKKALEVSSVNQVMTSISTFLNESVRYKYASPTDFDTKGFYVKETEKEKVAFEVADLLLMQRTDHSEHPKAARFDQVRTLSILGAFSGLRRSDWVRPTRNDVEIVDGERYINIRADKTEGMVAIPLTPILEKTLDACNWEIPNITIQRYNETVKEYCQFLGISQPVTVTKTTGNVSVQTSQPKHEKISSHACRRFFIRFMLDMKVPPINIMAVTGHSTESQMMAYAGLGMTRRAAGLSKALRQEALELAGFSVPEK